MSFNLANAHVGDMLSCAVSSDTPLLLKIFKADGYNFYRAIAGVLIGKFLVVAKDIPETNNNKNDDKTALTLHIVYKNPEVLGQYAASDVVVFISSENVVQVKIGSTFNIPVECINHEGYSWNLDYRPVEISK